MLLLVRRQRTGAYARKSMPATWSSPSHCIEQLIRQHLHLNLRSPRDYVVRSSVRRLFAPVVCVR